MLWGFVEGFSCGCLNNGVEVEKLTSLAVPVQCHEVMNGGGLHQKYTPQHIIEIVKISKNHW